MPRVYEPGRASVDSSDDSSTESDLDDQVDQLMVDIFGNSDSDTVE